MSFRFSKMRFSVSVLLVLLLICVIPAANGNEREKCINKCKSEEVSLCSQKAEGMEHMLCFRFEQNCIELCKMKHKIKKLRKWLTAGIR